MMRAGDAAVEVLARAGVKRFYAVPGESFLEIMDAVEARPDLSLVSTRHESGASFMAEADGKLTGVPAVAMATRGVGASNLAIGVHTARQDSTPMVVLLGQVETGFLGREAFQEVDLPDFYREVTKYSATVHRAERLPEFVEKAVRIATSGRPGPVMLALPADILGEEIEAPDGAVILSRSRTMPSPEEIQEIKRRILEARRPVAIAGEGAKWARNELVSFAEKYGVGIYTAFRRQDRFPNGHPNYLGHLALGTPPEILKSLEGADLIFSIGSRLDEVTTQSYRFPKKGQKVIRIGADGFAADVRQTLSALVEAAPKKAPERNWSAAHYSYLEFSEIPESRSEGGIDPAEVISAMRRTIPEDAIVTNDAGNFSIFLHRYWKYDHPDTQLAPANGAMGYGVPAAVGVKMAAPKRTVVAVCGDGGFLMTGQEIETAVRYGLSLTVVVMRNGMHGTIAMHQARGMGRLAGTEIGNVDLASFARSLGAEGFSVENSDELIPALEAAVSSEGVSLVDIVTDPDLITPTARLSEMS
ncbi:MAG: thiamine pyrophosphate-binding protein [Actinomycetota bacterium]|nr:thiamine pyrophosphate-binding protein [Rubrobacter sp.]MDQ3508992.1 thiamine pyrophosphate-binding protein [Actinomycetota bacterium]